MIRRPSFTWPVTLAVVLLVLNVSVLVLWIIAQATTHEWALLTVGTIFLSLILIGMVLYLILTIKSIRLNRRQANFIDSVTHELKSPIASIKLCLQTLDMRNVGEDQQREFLRFMLEDVQRLDALIDHLLVAARLDDMRPEEAVAEVPLDPLLRECAEAIRRRYHLDPERIQLELRPCVVTGRVRDLEMIYMNLLDNAVKYAAKEPQVLVQVVPDGAPTVQTRISDNGKGIGYELRRKIFQRFFRGGTELERTTHGTGLGLYIVKSLVSKLRGKIRVQSRGPLKGATFEVDLPGRFLEESPGTEAVEIDSAAGRVPQPESVNSGEVGSSRVDLQACKLEYSIVSPK